MVGRASEFDALRQIYRDTVELHQPALVTLVGDAGVGKSRLSAELRAWLDAHTTTRSLEGRCLSYGRGITYWPLTEVLRQLLGLTEADDSAAVMAALGGRKILGLTFGLDVAGDLHPYAAKERLHKAWIELVNELTERGPEFLLIEDIHWAEDSLLELLERVATDATGPILLVCTARPELLDTHPAWGHHRTRRATVLSLDPLSSEGSRDLLGEILGVSIPTPELELIVSRAEGNPLFVEEIVRMLVDDGAVTREGDAWALRQNIADIDVPDSVQAVLAYRIDLWESKHKATLQAAAVIGRAFWVSPIRDLVGHDPDLRPLEEREFIRRVAESSLPGEREFVFRHALTRQV